MSAARLITALALGLLARAAAAQTPPTELRGFALQTYEPPPAGDAAFTVPGTDAPAHLVPAVGLVLSWAKEPLVLQQGGATIPGGRLVHRQFWGFLQGSVGLGGRVLLEASAPVALYQSGSRYFDSLSQVSAAALGDLRLGARAPLGALGPVSVAAALQLWLPSGSTDAFSSDGGVRAQPQVIAGGRAGDVEYGTALGLLYRASSDRGLSRTGTAVSWSAAGAWVHGPWRLGPELYGRYQFEGTTTSPLEGLLGARWRRGPVDAGVALGTSFNRAPGASPFRIIAQVGWRPPSGPSAEELAAAKAAAERAEAERLEAERLAADRLAAERAEAERLAAERLSAERAAAEEEAARVAALAAAEQARLTADRDGDAIPDVQDACPEVAGVAHAEPARHGCPPPAPEPVLVKLTKERIEILQAVQFETAKDVIRPESEALLTEVAGVLAAHPELTRVLVEGHTDAQGAKAFNVTLSEQRAKAVKRWLVERGGIDAARLTAEGYGPTRPIDSNDTKEGRARNRRVEFRIVEQR